MTLPTSSLIFKLYFDYSILSLVRPFVNDEDYEEAEFQTNIFKDGVGIELQEKLEKIADNSRNWVSNSCLS